MLYWIRWLELGPENVSLRRMMGIDREILLLHMLMKKYEDCKQNDQYQGDPNEMNMGTM